MRNEWTRSWPLLFLGAGPSSGVRWRSSRSPRRCGPVAGPLASRCCSGSCGARPRSAAARIRRIVPSPTRYPGRTSRPECAGTPSAGRWRRSPAGSSRASAARSAGSAQSSLGRVTWRRRTASPWRRTRIPAPSNACPRLSRCSQPKTWAMVRYRSRIGTGRDLAPSESADLSAGHGCRVEFWSGTGGGHGSTTAQPRRATLRPCSSSPGSRHRRSDLAGRGILSVLQAAAAVSQTAP